MAEDSSNETGEEKPITFQVKSSNDVKYTLSLIPSTTIADLKTKLAEPEYADVPPERQRLIYSGRVLKDGDTLETHKVKDGHTIHLVKSAASNQRLQPSTSGPGTNSSAPQPPPGVPTNIAAGTGNNPLAGLTGARYAGLIPLPGAGQFGPDGGMGPPPDTEQMISLLENPQFQSTLNEALQNPQVIDMMIQQNPMLREMGPGVRQMMQSPFFRRMMTDPTMIRQMTQMQRSMGLGQFGGNGGGNTAFPAPGITNTTPAENRQQQNTDQTPTTDNTQAQNPFGLFGGLPGNQGAAANPLSLLLGLNPNIGNAGGSATASTAPGDATVNQTRAPADGAQTTTSQTPQNQANPFAMLFNPALFGQPPPPYDPNARPAEQEPQRQQQTQAPNPSNLFASMQNNPAFQDPALLAQMLQALGAQNQPPAADPANNPFAALFGLGGQGAVASPPPQDSRPPEERYAEQLRQLNDMGFYEFERNVEALRRAGGSVQGAIEYLLSQP